MNWFRINRGWLFDRLARGKSPGNASFCRSWGHGKILEIRRSDLHAGGQCTAGGLFKPLEDGRLFTGPDLGAGFSDGFAARIGLDQLDHSAPSPMFDLRDFAADPFGRHTDLVYRRGDARQVG